MVLWPFVLRRDYAHAQNPNPTQKLSTCPSLSLAVKLACLRVGQSQSGLIINQLGPNHARHARWGQAQLLSAGWLSERELVVGRDGGSQLSSAPSQYIDTDRKMAA